MLRLFSLLFAILSFGQILGAQPPGPLAVDAFARAAQEHKLVLLHFVAPEPNATGLGMIRVEGSFVRERFVKREIFSPDDPSLLLRHRITEFPTLVVFRSDGSEVDRLVGHQPESEVSAFLKTAAGGTPLIEQLTNRAKVSGKVEDHGRLGDALIKRAMFAEALREYAWCLKEGRREDPAGFQRLLKLSV